MSANVIDLAAYRNPGNGARAAIAAVLDLGQAEVIDSRMTPEDFLLAHLWSLGFKVVPLDGTEG